MAQTATVRGVVRDENKTLLGNVNISTTAKGTISNADGTYLLNVPAGITLTLTFSYLGYKKVVLNELVLKSNEVFEFNPVLKPTAIQVDEVIISSEEALNPSGTATISSELAQKIPGANAGVENILKLLPGVASNNELSTQYAVRGGNYDENLVYVNEIEVYRPFLIRSGQQEGLSFINSDLVQNLQFSAGGFQAKYGDKLSSVLDITYRKPQTLDIKATASFLGASTAVATISQNKKFTSVSGLRFRDNSLLVNSQQTKTNFNPTFIDAQTYLSYKFSEKFQLNFLGGVSRNAYKNEPLTRQTNFGTLNDPRALFVFYEGQENNTYTTELGALKADFFPNEKLNFKIIGSVYHTAEVESSDVIAQYELGAANSTVENNDPGNITVSQGVASQFNRARNTLDALIVNIEHKGTYKLQKTRLEWGAKYTHEDIRDQIRESEFIDSAGFSIRPPLPEFINNQPQEPFETPLVPFESISALNFVKTERFSGYLQYNGFEITKHFDLQYTIGLRAQYWTIRSKNSGSNSQTIFSPRMQLSVLPYWKQKVLFRVSGGLYQQPPFYRELRDQNGVVQVGVKAQRAAHLVFGNEYQLFLWGRPFKLVSETYYKDLDRVNPYTLEDVRIRYLANNEAKAFAYGTEFRLNGAFVPGTESWVSVGYLSTKENINNRGFISRPTDQRFKLGILFQDYVPTIPNLKMYLNLVYNTGVPGGSPSYADPYQFQNRLRAYKRADLGISHIFVDENQKYPKNHWLHYFKELSVGAEIFNLFNNQNSITNTWVFDVDSRQQFAIPNFMTTRVLNLRVNVRF